MYTEQTRKLFSTIVQKTPLTDQLLQRPPFKFLHDVIIESINKTGFLLNDFSIEELDSAKVSATKDSKTAFLQKVVDLLNFDGSLDKVKPSKIVAGKEPEFTNLMLQKLASEALTFVSNKKQEKKRKDSSKSIKDSKENILKKKESSSKLKDKNKLNTEEKPKREKSEKNEKKIPSKTRKLSKDKSSNEGKIRKSKEKLVQEMDEGLGMESHISIITQNNNDSAIVGFSNGTQYSMEPESSRTLPDCESSGGTYKGGEDSGIADETGESERHDSERRRRSSPKINKQDIEIKNINTLETNKTLARPTTAAPVRPQTAFGRPGTAMTRAAPPKLKRTKIADIDPTSVSVTPSIQNVAFLLEEQKSNERESDVDQFLLEEDEDMIFATSKDVGANVATLNETEHHGHLIKKIIENSRELAKEGVIEDDSDHFNMHEQRRIRLEIESVQNFLQQTTQNVQPLTRILEFITDDFDTILKEIEESRKSIAHSEQIIRERNGKSTNEMIFALSAQLRNFDIEINDVHKEIASSTAMIIENEKKIQGILCNNKYDSNF